MIFSFGFGLCANWKLTLKSGDQKLERLVLIKILKDSFKKGTVNKISLIVHVYIFHYFLY